MGVKVLGGEFNVFASKNISSIRLKCYKTFLTLLERRAALCVSGYTEDLGFYSRQESVKDLTVSSGLLGRLRSRLTMVEKSVFRGYLHSRLHWMVSLFTAL